ncbi:MAG: tyrosine-type recombinase/integrase [Candidatus Methanomethylophilaceae archaeon]|nr:tyrosine-type recombinase/integrase [Candidatus Methanomethylophilaceae archaeon]
MERGSVPSLAPLPSTGADNVKLGEFKEDCKLRGMSHGSTLSYISSIRIFMQFLDARGKAVEGVDKILLKAYIDHLLNERKVAFPTLESHFSALSAFYDWLVFEEEMPSNPVLPVRKRYLRRYKGGVGLEQGERKLISVEEMARLVNSILNVRDRAVVLLLAKTGMRRGELISLDVQDVDLVKMSIKLKPTAKRSNRLLFFDEETKRILVEWLHMREQYARADCPALFVTESGGRANKNHIYGIVTKHAERVGLHNPKVERIEDHFTPHCCRHWFTTHLRRRGMPREHIQELRGDIRPDAMDIYYHLDPEDLRKSYLAYMPSLGMT